MWQYVDILRQEDYDYFFFSFSLFLRNGKQLDFIHFKEKQQVI